MIEVHLNQMHEPFLALKDAFRVPDAHYPDYMEVWQGGGASLSFGASLQKPPNHFSKTTVTMIPGARRLYSLSLKNVCLFFSINLKNTVLTSGNDS